LRFRRLGDARRFLSARRFLNARRLLGTRRFLHRWRLLRDRWHGGGGSIGSTRGGRRRFDTLEAIPSRAAFITNVGHSAVPSQLIAALARLFTRIAQRQMT
jgi:hypothetical protein